MDLEQIEQTCFHEWLFDIRDVMEKLIRIDCRKLVQSKTEYQYTCDYCIDYHKAYTAYVYGFKSKPLLLLDAHFISIVIVNVGHAIKPSIIETLSYAEFRNKIW